MVQEEMIKKGPWTEHEDGQLLFYVNLFGDRRWDFIAKVSGLKRTGKSCRLRWVNYLHPGLKRGKMTPHEERLVLELHSKWGNRWSRIARKLPGRTDNEIKNYWRTHMRKKAQEKKRTTMSPASSSISNSSNWSSNSSNCSSNPHVDSMPMSETEERSFYDTGGLEMQVMTTARSGKNVNAKTTSSPTVNSQEEISMDEFWKGIGLLEEEGETITPVYDPCSDLASPIWDYNPDSLWMMMSTDNQEERNTTKMFNYPMSDQFGESLTSKFSSFI